MKKIILGDLFELQAVHGKAYIQCVDIPNNNNDVELIKVFYTIYKEGVTDINLTTEEDFFFIRFPLRVAYRKNIVKKIGNVPLPNTFELPKYLRRFHSFGHEPLGWHIIDTKTEQIKLVKHLTDDQKKLSPWGGMNDTLIIELLEKGWRLEKWTSDNMFE